MIEVSWDQHGVISYEAGLKRQQELVDLVSTGNLTGAIMTLQHKPCLTFGKNADGTYLISDESSLGLHGIDLVHTDRGGEITAHNPGQLVVYPILSIQILQLSPKKLVARLLGAVVDTLKEFGLSSYVDDQRPGVWVDDKKICAVGIRIQRRVSTHGIALNIDNDLGIFSHIVPCGIREGAVTRLYDEVNIRPSFATIEKILLDKIADSLSVTLVNSSVESIKT